MGAILSPLHSTPRIAQLNTRRHSDDSPHRHRKAGHTMAPVDSTQDKKGMKSKAPAQPLRRGDACLMCRAKKLKCSAQKPSCDQCTKRKDRCVYDAVRPASRVEKLERKLAAIEDQELRAGFIQRRFSAEDYTLYNKQVPHTPTLGTDLGAPILGAIDYSCMGLQPPTVASVFSGVQSSCTPQLEQQQSFAWPTGGPGAFTPASLSNQTMLTQPMSAEGVQLDTLPWPLLNATVDVSTYWPSNSVTPPQPLSLSGSPQLQGLESLNVSSSGAKHIMKDFNDEKFNQAMFPVPTMVPHQPVIPPMPTNTFSEIPPLVSQTVEEVITQAASLGANDMGEREISQNAKDYLLDLFFCPNPPRAQFGSEAFTEEQFRARLLLQANERPHDCLLFAMYTSAASHSYIPAVKSLENALFSIAAHKLEEAISSQDRLIDAINSSKSLSKWLFSKSRPLDAYHYSWKAVTLCMACKLHRIPSSVWNPVQGDEGSKMDDRWPVLGPPKSQWDLCQRIHAFWSAWGNERGMMLIIPWPSAMRDEQITTPLPRPPEDFLDGTIEREPDITIRDLYDLPHCKRPSGYNFFFGYFMSAVHLLSRSKSLLQERPEGKPTYRRVDFESPCAVRTPRKDYPMAYREMLDLCEWLQGHLLEDLIIRRDEAPSWNNPDVPVYHMCLLTTRMFLHPLDGDEYDRETGTRAALDAAALIKLWIDQLESGEGTHLKGLIGSGLPQGSQSSKSTPTASSRHKNGLSGPYCLTAWFWVADRLVKAAVGYRSQGRFDEARQCITEGQMIVEGLKSLGLWTRLGSHSAKQADSLERATQRGMDDGLSMMTGNGNVIV